MLSSEKKEFIIFLSIILLVVLVFSFALFGIVGIRVVFGLIIVSLPFYFILNNFEFNEGEKIVLSILLGLAIFPSFAYLIGFVVSFRLAIAITFIALVGAAVASNKFKTKKTGN